MPDMLPPEEVTNCSATSYHGKDQAPDIIADIAAFLDRFLRLAAVPLSVVFSLTSLAMCGALLLNGLGIIHADFGPFWHDFQSFFSAGVAALKGNGGKIYDFYWHSEHIKQVIGPQGVEFGWHYPPQFLLFLGPLALLPVPVAFMLWCLLPLAVFVWLVYRLIPDWRTALIATGCPIIIINTNYAQNGVLSTVFIGLAMLPFIENKKPSALSTSLLAFKPHMGLVFPVAFAAGRLWSTIWLTAFWLTVQIGITALAFGPQIWMDFWGSLTQSKTILLTEIGAGAHHYVSVFGSVRLLDGPPALAYLAQLVSAGLTLYVLWKVWRTDTSRPLKAALLVASIALTAPYLIHYDMVVAVLACVLLIRQHPCALWVRRDRLLMAGLWLCTAFNYRLQEGYHIPAGLICNLLLYYLVHRIIRFEQTANKGSVVSHSAASGQGSAH